MSVKEVQNVVQNVFEADDRCKNIIVFGLKESDDEDINIIIDEVLENVGYKPRKGISQYTSQSKCRLFCTCHRNSPIS